MTDGQPITSPVIHAYLERIRPASDPILREMEELAEARHFPYLGAQCARVLHLLVKITNARRIFELGSGFGYTMYWMALALPPGGMVTGTDNDPRNVTTAREFFRRGGIADRTDLRMGDALTIFRDEPGPFDIVVCDINKESYPAALDLARSRLRHGGILVADNVLWGGRVADTAEHEPSTEAIREFTRSLHADPGFFTAVLPIRDGLSISVRIAS